jgi:glycosyltransferase involved in cell wall biosynthesis
MQSLVSVVIASYNHELYIERAIFSVLEQTYSRIQLIVIDDCSTDATFHKIKFLSDKYGFICEQRLKNQGHGSINVNYAATKYVKGKYLAVCASDDWWHKEKIEKQVELIETDDNCALCYTSAFVFDSKGRLYGEGGGLISSFDDFLFSKRVPAINNIPASSQLYRTSCFFDLGGYDEKAYVEDLDFILRLADKYKMCYLPEVLCYVQKHDNNISRDIKKMHEGVHFVVDKWKHKSIYKKAKKRIYYCQYLRLLENGYWEGFLLAKKIFPYFFTIKSILAFFQFFFICLFGKPALLLKIRKIIKAKRLKKLEGPTFNILSVLPDGVRPKE